MYNKYLSTILFLLLTLLVADLKAQSDRPLVIAHRGASGHLPEHTLESYALAIEMGADYIEPDLVLTKDGVLITRHDHYLSNSTDIADHPEFATRKKTIGHREDWYTEDFILLEIKKLRARQAFRGRSKEHDGKYEIPTFQQVIDLVKRESAATGRSIGLYPEIKKPAYFNAKGYDFAGALLDILRGNDLSSDKLPVFIQSFEADILKELNERTDLPLVQLVTVARGATGKPDPSRSNIPLKDLSAYAQVVAPIKMLLVSADGTATTFVEQAHRLGLSVHVWTFRNDAYPTDYFSSGAEEQAHFFKLGIDGIFTDFPDTGVAVRNRLFPK